MWWMVHFLKKKILEGKKKKPNILFQYTRTVMWQGAPDDSYFAFGSTILDGVNSDFSFLFSFFIY